jgi:eukaryotic-like serine/threonine-protein kinase
VKHRLPDTLAPTEPEARPATATCSAAPCRTVAPAVAAPERTAPAALSPVRRARGLSPARWRRLAALGLGLVLVSLVSACYSIASPQGWADPVFANNGALVYYAAHGQLNAYDITNQSQRWTFPTAQDKQIKLQGIYSTPVLDSQTIYFGAYDGNVYALNQANGQLRWTYTTGSPIIGGILLQGSTLYVANTDGHVLALRAADGQRLWQQSAGQRVWSTPIDAGNLIVVTSMDKSVYAFDSNGKLAWQSKVAQAAIASTPEATNATITFGAFDKRFYAIQQANGDELWRSQPAGSWFWTRGLVSGGDLYAGNLDGNVYDFDAGSGALKWHTDLGAPIRSAPVLSQGVLIVADRNGTIYGLDPATGAQKWPPINAGQPVLANLVQQANTVYALTQPSGKSAAHLLQIDAATGSSKTALGS